jgi:hypothetical protein
MLIKDSPFLRKIPSTAFILVGVFVVSILVSLGYGFYLLAAILAAVVGYYSIRKREMLIALILVASANLFLISNRVAIKYNLNENLVEIRDYLLI